MENDRLWLDYTISGQGKKLVNASLAILATIYPGRTYAGFSTLVGFTPNLGEQRYVPHVIFQPDYLLAFDPEAAPSRSVPLSWISRILVCVWVAWCEHCKLNRCRSLIFVCVGSLVRATEFEPSSCVCTTKPHKTQLSTRKKLPRNPSIGGLRFRSRL